MGDECAKAVARRSGDPRFHEYLSGHGIDIGAGGDGLSKHVKHFPEILSVRDWDIQDGDAQYMKSVDDSVYDFVHSSHCLEHLRDAKEAISNWFRILKPGGFLVVIVPDWDLYEHRVWPSRFNGDHKQSFTLGENHDDRVLNLAEMMEERGQVVIARTLTETIPEGLRPDADWSCPAGSEPAIEVVAKKVLDKHSRG